MINFSIKKLICRVFGHNYRMVFTELGPFWCWSAGGYHCDCARCGSPWELTDDGYKCLLRSLKSDPRIRIEHDEA